MLKKKLNVKNENESFLNHWIKEKRLKTKGSRVETNRGESVSLFLEGETCIFSA